MQGREGSTVGAGLGPLGPQVPKLCPREGPDQLLGIMGSQSQCGQAPGQL